MDFFKEDSLKEKNGLFLDDHYYKLFNTLIKNEKIKNIQGAAFSFSYYYLASYLWKYAKYDKQLFDKKDYLNAILKRERYSIFDYLIKKDGLLEEEGLLKTTNNFPIAKEFDKETKEMNYFYIDDLDKESKREIISKTFKKYSAKKPIRFYQRESELGYNLDISNTVFISLYEFLKCIDNKELGYIGFYFYYYLKYNIVKYGGYEGKPLRTTYPKIKTELGINERMITKLTKELIKINLIKKESILQANEKGIKMTISYFELGNIVHKVY